MRSLVFALLAVLGMTLLAGYAEAGRRHRCCCMPQPACCVPVQTCAPVPATPAPQPDATAPGSESVLNSYQSFSYEPGSVPPRVYAPAATYRRRSLSLYNQVRGDRKASGY